jgi:hypothetical protein
MKLILEGKKTETGIVIGILWSAFNAQYPDAFNPATEQIAYLAIGAFTTWAAVIRRKRELKAKGVK